MWALHWILSSWREGLGAEAAAEFDALTVADILRSPDTHLHAPFCTSLSKEKQLELASATVLTAVKPPT